MKIHHLTEKGNKEVSPITKEEKEKGYTHCINHNCISYFFKSKAGAIKGKATLETFDIAMEIAINEK